MGDINGATHHKVLTSLHQKFGNVTVIPGVIKLFHKCDPSACEALRPHHEIFIAVHDYLEEILEYVVFYAWRDIRETGMVTENQLY